MELKNILDLNRFTKAGQNDLEELYIILKYMRRQLTEEQYELFIDLLECSYNYEMIQIMRAI